MSVLPLGRLKIKVEGALITRILRCFFFLAIGWFSRCKCDWRSTG